MPFLVSAPRSWLVAATRRTSTRRVVVSPTFMNSPVSITRSSLTWVSSGVSPISSKKMVPLWAASKYPLRVSSAPVKDPFLWPNSSLSIIPAGMAPQLTVTSGSNLRRLFLWIALATISLPVPDSPVTSTEISVGAIWAIVCSISWICSDSPRMPDLRCRVSMSMGIALNLCVQLAGHEPTPNTSR